MFNLILLFYFITGFISAVEICLYAYKHDNHPTDNMIYNNIIYFSILWLWPIIIIINLWDKIKK